MPEQDIMEKIISLAKQRGFIYPGSEIYGGLANSWDYGPLGVELKNNVKSLWWDMFVRARDDMVGLDAALIMNPKVWEASGHVSNFNDPMVECKKCHTRFRADTLPPPAPTKGSTDTLPPPLSRRGQGGGSCLECGGELTKPQQFNMMFRTHLGPVASDENVVYLRPETAQAIFVNFKNVLNTSRKTLPFGVAQIGKAFRNEITPGNYIFRTREFEQMEIEYFIPAPKDDKEWERPFDDWRKAMHQWIAACGINPKKIHELDVPTSELAHYSKKTIDFQFDFPFGTEELYGLAYRTDFDLKNHEKYSGQSTTYRDPESGEEFWPHVIEPSLGVDRTLLAVLCGAYEHDEKREVLHLKPALAPYKAAVFPLMRNKPDLVKKARTIYESLRKQFMTAWDDRGNIGKRYYSQDQIGTPFCITIDFTTLEDGTATIRDRDTMQQERIKVAELEGYLREKLS